MRVYRCVVYGAAGLAAFRRSTSRREPRRHSAVKIQFKIIGVSTEPSAELGTLDFPLLSSCRVTLERVRDINLRAAGAMSDLMRNALAVTGGHAEIAARGDETEKNRYRTGWNEPALHEFRPTGKLLFENLWRSRIPQGRIRHTVQEVCNAMTYNRRYVVSSIFFTLGKTRIYRYFWCKFQGRNRDESPRWPASIAPYSNVNITTKFEHFFFKEKIMRSVILVHYSYLFINCCFFFSFATK